jgi:hypothetical protein
MSQLLLIVVVVVVVVIIIIIIIIIIITITLQLRSLRCWTCHCLHNLLLWGGLTANELKQKLPIYIPAHRSAPTLLLPSAYNRDCSPCPPPSTPGVSSNANR